MRLFYAPQMGRLATHISEASSGNIRLGSIRWGHFPDGTPNLSVYEAEQLQREDVGFLASFDPPNGPWAAGCFEQLAAIYALPSYTRGRFSVILPYFPFGQNDRVDRIGQIATAKTAARMLSATPGTHGGGLPLLLMYDLHALQEQFYFSDRIAVDMQSAHALFEEAARRLNTDRLSVAFPDEGARKRFAKDWEDYPHIVCEKRREGGERVVAVKEGEVAGRDVVIRDDILQSGKTVIACCHALKRLGARSVGVFATHGVLPAEAWERFTPDLFAYVSMTDSCPQTVNAVQGREPFRVLSLAELIVKDLCLR